MWFGSDLIEKHKEEKQLNKKKLSFWRTHDLMIDILNLCVYLFVCLCLCWYPCFLYYDYQLLDTCCGP